VKWDFRHHLLLQIEMLRGDISHEELSTRLEDVTERCLARYVVGKSFLTESEFKAIAKALNMEAHSFACAWAASLGLRISGKDAVNWMVDHARNQWRQYSRIADRAVPSNPSPMAVIRAKYADRLSWDTPPLWFGAHFDNPRRRDTPENRARFARAYEMLVQSVHLGLSARDIGALRGISGERARQLMVYAAYAWAASEKIDLCGKSVPFKNEAKLVKNLYAALRFFAQQHFNELAGQVSTRGSVKDSGLTA
jgi:hypothetical protein